jgi:hypothetical protein
MANLTAIKEKIKNISDYSPQLAAYNDQLDDLINDAYYTIWTMRRWTFGFKEYYFKFHPDMTTSRENPGLDTFASVVKGSREVTFCTIYAEAHSRHLGRTANRNSKLRIHNFKNSKRRNYPA